MDFAEALHAAKKRRSDAAASNLAAGKAVLARMTEHVHARILEDVVDTDGARTWSLLHVRSIAYSREHHTTGMLLCRSCWTRADQDSVKMLLAWRLEDQAGFMAWFRAFVAEHFGSMHLTVSVKNDEWDAELSLPTADDTNNDAVGAAAATSSAQS